MNPELSKIYCGVGVYLGNRAMVSPDRDYTKEAVAFLKKNGVDAEVLPPSMKGAGGYTFWEIVKQLWEHKHIFAIIVATIKYLRTMYWAWLYKRRVPVKPLLKITLVSNSDKELFAPYQDSFCGLESIGEELADWLSRKYPLLEFGRELIFNISAYDYRLTIVAFPGSDSAHNRARLMNRLAKTKVKHAVTENIFFGKYKSLMRVLEFKDKNDVGKIVRTSKEYYYLSSMSIGDRIKSYNVVPTEAAKGGIIYKLKNKPKTISSQAEFSV